MQIFKIALGTVVISFIQAILINPALSSTNDSTQLPFVSNDWIHASTEQRRSMMCDLKPKLIGLTRSQAHELLGFPDLIERNYIDRYRLSATNIDGGFGQDPLPTISLDVAFIDEHVNKFRITSREIQSDDAVKGNWTTKSPLIWTDMFPPNQIQSFLGNIEFSTTEWISHPQNRSQQLCDLTARHPIVGITTEALETLLGKADLTCVENGQQLKSYMMKKSNSCETGGRARIDFAVNKGVISSMRLAVHSFQNPWLEKGVWITAAETSGK
jgi:hypothetical protein